MGKLPPVLRHRLFTFFSALSLLLCVAMCVLWVRSQWVCDSLGYYWMDTDNGEPVQLRCLGLATDEQRIHVTRFDTNVRAIQSPTAVEKLARMSPRGFVYNRSKVNRDVVGGIYPLRMQLWFSSQSQTHPPVQAIRDDWIPVWVVALPLALGGIPLLLRLLRTICRVRRGRRRCCPACGYDLRATPDRCPECGTVPGIPTGKQVS